MSTFAVWRLAANQEPRLLRLCHRCRRRCAFASTRKFRVNAQKKRLDVWLIYACVQCGARFNARLVHRRAASDFASEEIAGFHHNRSELALRLGCDRRWLRTLDVQLDLDGLEYTVSGVQIAAQVELRNDWFLPARIDQVMANALNLSRSRARALGRRGVIAAEDAGRLTRFVPQSCRLRLDAAALSGERPFRCAGSEERDPPG